MTRLYEKTKAVLEVVVDELTQEELQSLVEILRSRQVNEDTQDALKYFTTEPDFREIKNFRSVDEFRKYYYANRAYIDVVDWEYVMHQWNEKNNY